MQDTLLKKLKQLEIVDKNQVNLKNAGPSNLYANIKKAYGQPDILNLMAEEIWNLLNKETTCLAASGLGGIPLATAISSKYNLKLTLIREAPKDHGQIKTFEGHTPTPQDSVSIVDDVFTTGGSLAQIAEMLKPTEAKILGCYVVVKRGGGNLDLPLKYLFTLEDLL